MSLVVVTGASGFLGSHIIAQLLDGGYRVRGVARSRTAPKVAEKYTSYGDKFEVVVAEDLATSDLSNVFKGADALIHVASPLGGASAAIILQSAVDGTLKVVEAAVKAGIKKVVVTSSVVALYNPTQPAQATIGEKDHNNMTWEEALKPENVGLPVYAASKGLAEQALRKFAAEHPELDVATVHPPYIYGPTGPGQVITAPAAGTNEQIYVLIKGEKGRPLPAQINPQFVNVHDAARAHVLALKAPPSDTPKRIVIRGGSFTYKQATEYLLKERPELKERLPVITGNEPPSRSYGIYDNSSAARIIGLKDYIGWQETLSSTIDDILQKEKVFGVPV
ncbi:NAD(P)-binding protein [Auriscalpium vulgare]|uniref:NAD(P)-binding protein n=1 Tax=Auriscalpium vulgare TaxID=40419 RepID=A0ACB8RIG3_9AGAM|nr:NAD(P)-binding protein [Auriscalpium vulgare]